MALIFGNKLTVEQRLEAATSKIMGHSGGKYDALPGLLMHGSCMVDEGTPTACTDGLNEWYGRKFCDGLNDPELRFLRMHEVLHKMRMDLFVWKHLFKEDAKLAGQACDYVNNLTLVELDAGEGFIKMPTCGLLDPSYHGMGVGLMSMIMRRHRPCPRRQLRSWHKTSTTPYVRARCMRGVRVVVANGWLRTCWHRRYGGKMHCVTSCNSRLRGVTTLHGVRCIVVVSLVVSTYHRAYLK